MSILDEYVAKAAELYGSRAADILGPSRFRCDVNARRHVMKQLRLAGWSVMKIGRAFNRHHSSVLHLTQGHDYGPPTKDRRPNRPRIARPRLDLSPEAVAERHQLEYENSYHQNAVDGSLALLAAQVRFNQFPCRVAT